MKTLELKHLAIAFSNNQKVLYYDDERCCNQICRIVSLQEDTLTILSEDYQYDDISFDDVKLVAFPLSYLTKEIDVNGEKFVPILKLANMVKQYPNWAVIQEGVCGNEFYKFKYDSKGAFYLKDSFYRIITNQLELFQKLLEWHFDVFGLIEQGLAIDINTL